MQKNVMIINIICGTKQVFFNLSIDLKILLAAITCHCANVKKWILPHIPLNSNTNSIFTNSVPQLCSIQHSGQVEITEFDPFFVPCNLSMELDNVAVIETRQSTTCIITFVQTHY